MTAVIDARELRKRFPGGRDQTIEAVRGVSLQVTRGEIVGFLGPNGAGKTTTLRMLTTLLPIDGGSATVAGLDVRRQPGRVRGRIGYVSQLGGADELATGRENLILQGRLYGRSRAEVARRVGEVLDEFDLAGFADRRVRTYSGGQRRRLDVALGVVHEPEVLFLDEPSTGLDPQNRASLWDHVRGLRDGGTTVFLTTHYLDEADVLCDRIMIIDHGTVVAEGTPRALKQQVAGDAIVLVTRDADAAARAAAELAGQPAVRDLTLEGDAVRLYASDGAAALPGLLRLLDQAGLPVRSLRLSEPSLDDVFLRQTGRSLRDAGPPAAGPPTTGSSHHGGAGPRDLGDGGMKLLTDIGLLFRRHLIQLLRSPVWLVVGFSTPILYLALFTPLLKHLVGAAGLPAGNVLDLFLPGILALLAFASGSGPGFSTIFELRSGVTERLRVTPASRFAILAGPILASMLLMFAFDVVVVAIGAVFGFHLHASGLLLLCIVLALLMATMAAFSIAAALTTKDINGFAAIINGLNLPVLLLGGVLLPISLGPAWMRVLAHVNPLYYAVTSARALAAGAVGAPAVWQAFAVLVPLCAVTAGWATSVVRTAVA